MVIAGTKFIGARAARQEHRWTALLNAALEQSNPTPALIAAINELKRKRSPGRPRNGTPQAE